MAVILLDNLIEDFVESVIRIHAASVDTDARVNVLRSREDHLLERYASFILLASVLFINLRCKKPT